LTVEHRADRGIRQKALAKGLVIPYTTGIGRWGIMSTL
jgi:hypothetical protein